MVLEVAHYWTMVKRTDPRARALADRHYSRKVVGAKEFCPPGNNIVLIVPSSSGAAALWVSHRPDPNANLATPRMDGFDYWDNPYFRNESDLQASSLIREALAITLYLWGMPLKDGFHSFTDPKQVKAIMRRGEAIYGYCFYKAGFCLYPQRTKSRHLLRFVMSAEALREIPPLAPLVEQLRLFSTGGLSNDA